MHIEEDAGRQQVSTPQTTRRRAYGPSAKGCMTAARRMLNDPLGRPVRGGGDRSSVRRRTLLLRGDVLI
jgi:hypothetical protein